MKHSLPMLFAATCLLSCTAISSELSKTQLCIDEHPHVLEVEIADTYGSRARGLMAREQLAEHAGMWFRYTSERPADAGFWMYNTLIPLDIAYVNETFEIVKIITMEPCPSIDPRRCPAYEPGVPYFGAVELNKGYFSKYDIGIGRKFKICPQGD